MADETKITPADGQAGAAAPKGEAGAADAASGKTAKTFTQEELDAILERRLARAVPADYEDLKKLRDEQIAAKANEKTEIEQAREAQKTAEKRASDLEAARNADKRETAIVMAAVAAKVVDPEVVAALLASSDEIVVDKKGAVLGAKEAVEALLAAKPYLKGSGTPSRNGGEFGGVDQKTAAEKIKQLETEASQATDPKIRQAKYNEARDLKMQNFQPRA